ncbi:MAG: hypothetical protein WAN11_16015 [Syntrophobacteraceae bacterium]
MNIEINVTELRKQRRPLWMSNFMHDSYADLMGGGGDIYSDRLHPEWERDAGIEVEEQSRPKFILESESSTVAHELT